MKTKRRLHFIADEVIFSQTTPSPGETRQIKTFGFRATQDAVMEILDPADSKWKALTTPTTHDDTTPIEEPDGSATIFSLAYPCDPNSLDVFLNGLLLVKDQEYTLDQSNIYYTFTDPPPAGSVIRHFYEPLTNWGVIAQHTGEVPEESPDGARTNFSTSRQYLEGSLKVFLNGLLQIKDQDYTEDSDFQGYTFSIPPPSGAVIQHDFHEPPLNGIANRSSDRSPSENPDDSRTTFTTAKKFKSGTLQVYLNGLRLKQGVGKDYVEGDDLQSYVLTIPPPTGSLLQHRYEVETVALTSNPITVDGGAGVAWASDRTPSESPDGSRTVFTTAQDYAFLLVFMNRLLMLKDVDYTEGPGANEYTFTTPPLAQDYISHAYIVKTD